jgi:hypothetical protein
MASRIKNKATFSTAGIAAFLPRTSKKQVQISWNPFCRSVSYSSFIDEIYIAYLIIL